MTSIPPLTGCVAFMSIRASNLGKNLPGVQVAGVNTESIHEMYCLYRSSVPRAVYVVKHA